MHITRFQALHRLSNIGVARIRNRRHAFFHPAFFRHWRAGAAAVKVVVRFRRRDPERQQVVRLVKNELVLCVRVG